jgi:ATP-binding cassette subfamily C protein CydC
MKTFFRLLSYLSPFRWFVLLAILLGFLTIASNVSLLAFSGYLIAAAAIVPFMALLTIPIYIVRLTGVSRAVARYAERRVSHNLTFRLLTRLRVWFYQHIEPLAPAQVQAYRSGDLLSHLVNDIDELQNIYLRIVAPIVVAILICILTFYVFTIFHTTLAWVALAFLLSAGLLIPTLTSLLARGWGRRQLVTRAELNAQLIDGIQGLPELLIYGQANKQRRTITQLSRVLGRVQRRMALLTGMQQALNEALMNLAVWTILVLAIPLVLVKAINGVYLAFLALFILASFEAIQPLAEAFQFLGHSLAAGERLFKIVDTQPRVVEDPHPQPLRTNQQASQGDTLTFEHVHFAYEEKTSTTDTTTSEVLHDINFSLRPGQRIAIVGPSGAGKSTLVRLLLRFWDPTQGTIRLNGQDIRTLALNDLRAQLGVVAQDTHLFSATIRDNLLLAKPDASSVEIEQALAQAQFTESLAQLPEGLDTWVGEQGLRLSGGEKQRVAIARTLLKNAPLLILDEATANLDPQTEQDLLAALEELMRGRSTLVITHRLVAMERMDEILVLNQGRVVERGTHQDLMQSNGLYRQMFDLQHSLLDPA